MRRLVIPAIACLLALCPSCKKKGPDFTPEFACPGGPTCPDSGEEVLQAGASAVVINPQITEWMDHDEDGDFLFEPRPIGDDTWNDADGDGEWDAVWIAGFDTSRGRPASGIATDIEARAIVLSWKSTTIALVSLDLVGYFHADIEKARADIAAAHPDIDFVSVSSEHNHNGPDTMGLWGFDELWSGCDEDYMQTVRDGIVQAVDEAHGAMRPARVSYAAVEVDDNEHGACNFISDTRDPVIILNTMTLVHFTERDSGDTISTLVNWHSHPEYTGEGNDQLTADFPHYLRLGIEEGVTRGPVDRPGVGGVAIYFSGAVGGLLCPYDLDDLYGFEDLDGTMWDGHPRPGLDEAVGWSLADIALTALEGATEPEDACPLEVRASTLDLEAKNFAYHAMMLSGVFHRDDIHGFDDSLPVGPGNYPRLTSEASYIRIGRAAALGVPGEPTAEHFVGGYDGSHTPECYDGFIDPDTLSWPGNPNPPDLSQAPQGPYLFDRMRDRGVEYPMVLGLTGDEVGYLVPSYNFKLAEPGAYVTEPPGDHYEETASIGPDAWPAVEEQLIGFIMY